MEARCPARRCSCRNLCITTTQLCFLIGLWWLCELASKTLGLPIPGGVLGLAVLLVLLLRCRVPDRWVSKGAEPLLDHLLLFFVPATMSLLNHPEFLGLLGLKILFVIISGVVTVMVGTALIVEWHFRLRSRHAA